VEQRLEGVAEHRYAPLDFPWVVNQAIDRLKPSLYIFVETELWPNILRSLQRRNVPSILVNGRLSTRSFERQRLPVIRDFYRTMLNMISCCLMQSERDAQRMIELGAEPSRVRCTGNIKFDQPIPQGGGRRHGRVESGARADRPGTVAGGREHPSRRGRSDRQCLSDPES
jgi:3-deoxy-D-manno-octulosonic-acid transferase